ncbi:MAG: hypothetical protein LBR83_10650 [Clostridiales bacterium]|nr:hypothetical protein [Clostridiales bacterium]
MVFSQDDNGYVYLTDGRLRPLSKPKKKKTKHVQPTNTVLDLLAVGSRGLQDADIRKWLIPYSSGRLLN